MNAGKTVMMTFPGDSTATPVPRDAIAMAIQAGAKMSQRKAAPPVIFGPGGVPAFVNPKSAADAAPPAGAIGGSFAGEAIGRRGGPMGQSAGRVVGGTLGGTLGQAYQEGTYRAMGLGDAPGSIADEAKFQLLAGLGGEGLGATSNLAGRAMIRTGLPARMQDAGKAVQEMVKERLPIGWGGGKKAAQNLASKTAARDAVNAAADAANVKIETGPVQNLFEGMSEEFQLRGDRSLQLSALGRRYDDFVETWKRGYLKPPDAQKYLSSLDEEARTIWKSERKMGQYVPPHDRIAAQQARRLAGSVRLEMRRLVAGHKQTSARLSAAVAAKEGIDEAGHAGLKSLGSRFATGGALVAGGELLAGDRNPHRITAESLAGGAFLASPALLSRTGLALTDPRVLAMFRNAPRFLGQGGE